MNDILTKIAFENIKKITGLDATLAYPSDSLLYDSIVNINGIVFAIECKNTVDRTTAIRIIEEAKAIKEEGGLLTMLISSSISNNVFELLHANGVSAIETSGNCRIVAPPLYVVVSGQKRVPLPKDETHAYTPPRLKVILYLLLNKTNVNHTFREIAKGVGVSLGIVKYTIDDLIKKRYVIKTSSGRVLKGVKLLLEMWTPYYNQVLKPKLFIGNYEFVRAEDEKQWKSLALPHGMAWGGEVAANIIDGYLSPEKYEIYTSLRGIQLLATGLLKPARDGNVKVYNMFWEVDTSITAPLPIVYADLMSVDDSRCHEAAKRLLEHFEAN